jgi:hypothetical protein
MTAHKPYMRERSSMSTVQHSVSQCGQINLDEPEARVRDHLTKYVTEEEITVTVAAPASGQFSARMTTIAFPVRSDGISLVQLRAEWLRSQGLEEGSEVVLVEPA